MSSLKPQRMDESLSNEWWNFFNSGSWKISDSDVRTLIAQKASLVKVVKGSPEVYLRICAGKSSLACLLASKRLTPSHTQQAPKGETERQRSPQQLVWFLWHSYGIKISVLIVLKTGWGADSMTAHVEACSMVDGSFIQLLFSYFITFWGRAQILNKYYVCTCVRYLIRQERFDRYSDRALVLVRISLNFLIPS